MLGNLQIWYIYICGQENTEYQQNLSTVSLLNCFISYITYSAMNMFAGKQLNDLQDVYTCNSHSQQSVAVLMLLAGVAALNK